MDDVVTPGGVRVSRPLYQAKAELFKTLGHSARIRILELLSRVGGRRDAARGGYRGDQPVPAPGGAAPLGSGELPQGRLHGSLRADQPAGRRAAGRRPAADAERAAGRSGGTPGGSACRLAASSTSPGG